MKLQPTYRFRTGQWYILLQKNTARLQDRNRYTHLIYVSSRRQEQKAYNIKIISLYEPKPFSYRIYDSVLTSPKDCAYHTTYRIINKEIIPTLNEVLLRYYKSDRFWNENISPKIIYDRTCGVRPNCRVRHENYRHMECMPYYCLIYDFINELTNEQTQTKK